MASDLPKRGRPVGSVHSDETKRKIVSALRGRKLSPEHVQAIRDSWTKGKRRFVSAETRLKMSLAKKGKPFSEAHKQALRDAKQRRREALAHPQRRDDVSTQEPVPEAAADAVVGSRDV